MALGSIEVPEAGFSAFAALTAVAVNARRHWQRAHDDDDEAAAAAYLLLERRRPLRASSSVRDDDDGMACGAGGVYVHGGFLGWCPGKKIWAFARHGSILYGPGRTHGSGVRIGSAKSCFQWPSAASCCKQFSAFFLVLYPEKKKRIPNRISTPGFRLSAGSYKSSFNRNAD